jgi:hypothetical protein
MVGVASAAGSGGDVAGCSIVRQRTVVRVGIDGFYRLTLMGQPITVSVRSGARAEVRIFDLDRSLTGMALEVYPSPAQAVGERPPDVLARRLFDLGASQVSVYSNVVTVEADANAWADIEAKAVHTLEHLFEYYGDDAGWSPEALGKPAPEAPALEQPAPA